MIVIPIRVDDNLGFKVDFNILKKDQAFWLNSIFSGGKPHGFIPTNIRIDVYTKETDKSPHISLFPTNIITNNAGSIKMGLLPLSTNYHHAVMKISNMDFDGNISNMPSSFSSVSYTNTENVEIILSAVIIEYSIHWDHNDPKTWTISVETSSVR